MLKAKALCAVSGHAAPEIRPLVSRVRAPAQEKEDRADGIRDLIRGMQGMVITSRGCDAEVPAGMEELAVRMMNSSGLINSLLHDLRLCYHQGKKDFCLPLEGRSEAEKGQIFSLFRDMTGLVTDVHWCPEQQTLCGSLVMQAKAQLFLTGQYLELAVYKTMKKVLTELAESCHTDFEIYRNVQVASRKGIFRNEFDIVVCFNGIWYIVECKSGKNYSDWNRLIRLGRTYGIAPGQILLVDSWIPKRSADAVEYLYGYHVCSLTADTLESKVTEMIRNDMAA